MHRFAILQANDAYACLGGNYAQPYPADPQEVAALKERLQHEHDGHKKPRLQMLYLLASAEAHTRQGGVLVPCLRYGGTLDALLPPVHCPHPLC